ncbi:MAG: acyl-CoA/acyl-ACP dehydrogenase [Acidimicrobiaceae bacterium]|jgi:3-oxocholest-4-en-26-oyl-CoA dehydrogenase beta subunit|nr:acyl-CoA/acyl-ACP dehydrogenase [Acidimicrobiaceae bacterium]MBT5579804.1 acyl-CoA/acyl-ACP dehydrogenase [Acidimicrobiaceae bacterium]MBT5851755.1 acyl-CoA/acyl-ACP dehydrogenase [Acidimicrobiaceae bacterium]
MNFDLSEEQKVVSGLASQVFADLSSTDRVTQVEAGDGFDSQLWRALGEAGLLSLCLPESLDGSGMGMVELALMCESQGQNVSPVPLASSVVAAMTVAEHLSDVPAARAILDDMAAGRSVLTAAITEVGVNDPLNPTVMATEVPGGIRLNGEKPAVVALPLAQMVLVPAVRDGLVLIAAVDTSSDGVCIDELSTSSHESQGHLRLDDCVVPDDLVIADPTALDRLFQRSLVAMSAVQLGVGQGAVAHAAAHVSERHQFERPLSAFQAVSQRAADGYILNEVVRSTVLNAAWQLDHQTADSLTDVLTAAYWACEGTQRVVLGAQHLHGGVGSDVSYPVHRYFLWGMQNAAILGSASAHLARLGTHLADVSSAP